MTLCSSVGRFFAIIFTLPWYKLVETILFLFPKRYSHQKDQILVVSVVTSLLINNSIINASNLQLSVSVDVLIKLDDHYFALCWKQRWTQVRRAGVVFSISIRKFVWRRVIKTHAVPMFPRLALPFGHRSFNQWRPRFISVLLSFSPRLT